MLLVAVVVESPVRRESLAKSCLFSTETKRPFDSAARQKDKAFCSFGAAGEFKSGHRVHIRSTAVIRPISNPEEENYSDPKSSLSVN